MVLNIYSVDPKLVGYDASLQLVFALITFLLAYYAWKVSKLGNQRAAKRMSISFLLISVSYAILSLFNFLIIGQLNAGLPKMQLVGKIILFNGLGLYFQIVFMIAGLALFTHTSLNMQRMRVFWLLFLLCLAALHFGKTLFLSFLLAAILLLFTTYHYVEHYRKKKSTTALLICLAFGFWCLAKINYLFLMYNQIFYHIGNAFELISFLLFLYTLYLIRKQ